MYANEDTNETLEWMHNEISSAWENQWILADTMPRRNIMLKPYVPYMVLFYLIPTIHILYVIAIIVLLDYECNCFVVRVTDTTVYAIYGWKPSPFGIDRQNYAWRCSCKLVKKYKSFRKQIKRNWYRQLRFEQHVF